MTFANSFDPDQARQNVGPDKMSNLIWIQLIDTLIVFPEELILKKIADNKKHAKLSSGQRVNHYGSKLNSYIKR